MNNKLTGISSKISLSDAPNEYYRTKLERDYPNCHLDQRNPSNFSFRSRRSFLRSTFSCFFLYKCSSIRPSFLICSPLSLRHFLPLRVISFHHSHTLKRRDIILYGYDAHDARSRKRKIFSFLSFFRWPISLSLSLSIYLSLSFYTCIFHCTSSKLLFPYAYSRACYFLFSFSLSLFFCIWLVSCILISGSVCLIPRTASLVSAAFDYAA